MTRPRTSLIASALIASLPLAGFAFTGQAQDFTDDARFDIRLSAFNPEANIRFDGTGTATDGERSEDLAAAGSIDSDGRWRPRGEIAFHMTPRQ